MNASSPPPAESHDETARRRVIYLEDALILVCIALLWVPIVAGPGPWVWLVLGADLGLMVWLLARRKRRVDELFEELRKQREGAPDAASLYPGLPGFAPPQERPTVSARGDGES